MEHADRARSLVDRLNGDYVLAEGIPAPLAELLEAQVHATLALVEVLDRAVGKNGIVFVQNAAAE